MIKKIPHVRSNTLMNYIISKIKIPAFLGFIIILPLLAMEIINRRTLHETFPLMLFIGLWLMPVTFIIILTPILKSIKKRENVLANPFIFLIRITALSLIAIAWINLLADQMPCFLGIPGCD